MPTCHPAVRPIALGPARRRRRLDERLRLRMPRLFQGLTSLALSLPPRSRVRQALAAWGIRSGFGAYNRQDLGLVLSFYDPQVEIRLHHISGMEGEYHGHDGWRRYWRLWFDAWNESHMEPFELVEFRDRILVLGRIRCRAVHSGLTMEEPLAQLLTFRDGLVARHDEWFDHAAALEAVGLNEEVGARRG